MDISIIEPNNFLAKNFYHFIKNKKKIKKIYFIEKNTNNKNIKKYIEYSDKIFIFFENFKIKYKNNLKIIKEVISYKKKKKKFFLISSNQYNTPSIHLKKYEEFFLDLKKKNIIDLKIYRFPIIFGKWSKPNRHNIIATFCYKIIKDRNFFFNKNKNIELLYIDDLIKLLLLDIYKKKDKITISDRFNKTFKTDLINLKSIIKKIHSNYKSKYIINYNLKFYKYLYSTYLYFINKKDYKYKINNHNKSSTGFFLEIFKSKYFGQISLLKIKGKMIRGMHFHNTKYEKFLVIDGKVSYTSKDMFDKKVYKTILDSSNYEIINTIPGHIHSFKNLSNKSATIIVWANEIFNPSNTDTFYN
jgi:UDP-2-acetamido-2,6-beta-L-arabino-hexul-4-ose reductase